MSGSEPSSLDILSSYNDWTSHFPSTPLAANGLRYTGQSDLVECVLCGIKLGQWKVGDNIQERHFKASPNCESNKLFTSRPNNLSNNRIISDSNSNMSNYENNIAMDAQTSERPRLRSQFAPSRSDSRLPVPINITSELNRVSGGLQSNGPINHNRLPRAQIAKFQEENARLASYDNWPDSAPVKPPALAAAGLYYTGIGDKVKCPFCMGALHSWETGDIAMTEHSKHYPECPFVKYKNQESPLNGDSTRSNAYQLPRVPEPIRPQPPKDNNIFANPSAPVVAAGGKTMDWKEHDSVKIVHSMGYDMRKIRAAIDKLNIPLEEVKSGPIIDMIYEMGSDSEESDSEENAPGKSSAASHQFSFNGEESIEKSLEAGIARPSAKAHSRAQITTKPEFASSNPQPSAFPVENSHFYEKSDSVNTHDTLSNRDSSIENVTGALTTQRPEQPDIILPQRPINPKHKELSEEHNKLTKKKLCSVCEDADVGVLFLPCRHLIACENCSATLDKCALCDKVIIGTVKIYFP